MRFNYTSMKNSMTLPGTSPPVKEKLWHLWFWPPTGFGITGAPEMKPPCAFHRFMQKLFFGIVWEYK